MARLAPAARGSGLETRLSSRAAPIERRVGRRLFTVALVIYVFTAGGSLTTTDAVVTYDVTESMLTRGTVAMSGNLLGMDSQRGVDGRYYSPFGIGQSLYNVPFYAAARAFTDATGFRAGKPDTIPKAAVALGQTLLAAAVVWLTFRLAVAVTGDVVSSGLAALTLAFASVLWPYARFGFNQPLACATLLAAVLHAFLGIRRDAPAHLAWAGIWLGASLLTRHEMMLAAAPLGLWILSAGNGDRSARLRRVRAFAPGVTIGLVIWLAYNASRFGNPFDSGLLRDPVPGLGSPIADGLAGLLFSPSASLFLFSPMALAGVIGLFVLSISHRGAALLMAGVTLTFLLSYATLGNWIGGRSYGSRYLVVVLPYVAVGWAAWLARLGARRRLAFALVFVIGTIVQLPGVLVDYAKVSQAAAASQGAFSTAERQWAWRASPLVLNAKALATAVPANMRYLFGSHTPPSITPAAGNADRGFSQQLSFSLDFWWLYLFYLNVLPRAAVLVLVTLFMSAAAVSAALLSRSLTNARA